MGTGKDFRIQSETDLGSHKKVCVFLSLGKSLPLSYPQFSLWQMGFMIPASLTACRESWSEDRCESSILYRVVHYVSLNSFCVPGQDMALSLLFPLMAPMTPATPGSAHESLVWRASIFPVSQPSEALAGPGLSLWPAQARDLPGSRQGSRLPGA